MITCIEYALRIIGFVVLLASSQSHALERWHYVDSQCKETIIINETDTWNTKDGDTFEYAKRRCARIWPDAPCLTRFWKKGEGRYWASCGKREN